MKSIPQSFSWWCYANRSVENAKLLSEAKKIGYAGVDLAGDELWPQIVDAGLKIVAVCAHGGIENGLNDRKNATHIEQEILHKIEQAAEWKIPQLICFAGNRYEADDDTALKICAETLSKLAPAAEQAGTKLCVELLNSKVDHRGYQCDSSTWGVRLCQEVNSPAVTLLYDIYHMQIMEGDLIRTIQRDYAHFSHYHTAGNPGRGPLSEDQEINYPAVYRAIAATGYTGYIAHEFLPEGDPVEAIRAAYEQCTASLA